MSGITQYLSLCDSFHSVSCVQGSRSLVLSDSKRVPAAPTKLGPSPRGVRGQTALPSLWASGADGFGLLPLQMSASKRARKASSDLDQASMSPSEEENSESSSESEKTSDQVNRWLAPRVAAEQPAVRPCSLPSLYQDFTPEKKAVVRAPRRGPLAGRKKKVEVFWFSVLHSSLGDTPRVSLQGHQPLSLVRIWSILEEDEAWAIRRPQGTADSRLWPPCWPQPVVPSAIVQSMSLVRRRPGRRCWGSGPGCGREREAFLGAHVRERTCVCCVRALCVHVGMSCALVHV